MQLTKKKKEVTARHEMIFAFVISRHSLQFCKIRHLHVEEIFFYKAAPCGLRSDCFDEAKTSNSTSKKRAEKWLLVLTTEKQILGGDRVSKGTV